MLLCGFELETYGGVATSNIGLGFATVLPVSSRPFLTVISERQSSIIKQRILYRVSLWLMNIDIDGWQTNRDGPSCTAF